LFNTPQFMKYALLILSPPSSPTSGTAVAFAHSLIEMGHEVVRVFFLDAGTANGLASRVTPQDEQDRVAAWAEFSHQHNVELVACVSSALKHGVLDEREAQRHERGAQTLHPAFTIGGLGLLVDATSQADRLFSFGG
jgi:tRNA 2-thiouridine synthesizing protein D